MFRRFDYLAPRDVGEAIDALIRNGEAEVLAGGTDLLLRLREHTTPDKVLVDIKRCPGLRGIARRESHTWLGPLTTMQELLQSDLIRSEYRALWDAARVFGCLEIRNRATIGGNIVHASPGAESGTPLFAFEALAEITGPQGAHTLPIGEFWLGPGRVKLDKGELLTGIMLPRFEQPMDSRYQRISRTKGMDLASLGVTVAVLSPSDVTEREVRVAMAAVERTPYRNRDVEQLLSGCELDERIMAEAKSLIAESIRPRDTSLRANPDYKKAMVGNLTERILGELALLNA